MEEGRFNLPAFMQNDINESSEIFKSLLTTNIDISKMPPRLAQHTDFGSDFPGSFIKSPNYKFCRFFESSFINSDGEATTLNSCGFYDCTFSNGDFRYCDFTDTEFLKKSGKFHIGSCNFSYGNYINMKFNGVNFQGTSFRQMLINNSSFEDCTFSKCSFERSVISNCEFRNIDMRNSTFRFCQLKNIKFYNVIIHILDLAKNIGLINEISKNPSEVIIAYGDKMEMSFEQSVNILFSLIPFYYSNNDYYQVINIYLLMNDIEAIWKLLPVALKFAINNNDFSGLQDLCALIAKLEKFESKQLHTLYDLINSSIDPQNLPYFLLKSYISHMANIKNTLLDNPYDYPTATITFNTNISPPRIEKLGALLQTIETNTRLMLPDKSLKIQISHSSPYVILLFICGNLPDILTVCQVFYYSFGGAKALKDITNSRFEKANNKRSVRDKKNQGRKTKKSEISLAFGGFKFKYLSECEKHVESIEYRIT